MPIEGDYESTEHNLGRVYPPEAEYILDLLEEYYWSVEFTQGLLDKFDMNTVGVIIARQFRVRRCLMKHQRSVIDIHQAVNRLRDPVDSAEDD